MSSRPRAWDDATPPSASAPVDAAPVGAPPAPPPASNSALEAAERAAAIAAKLGQSFRSPSGPSGASPSSSALVAPRPPRADLDGEFSHDIEVNDLRNRYLLTKGSTQAQLLADTGASVVTKGTWLPDKSKATAADPPLYLHVVAHTKEILDKALAEIQKLIDQDLGALVEDRSQWARNRERFGQGPPGTGANAAGPGQPGGPVDNGFGQRGERRKWPEVKLPIELESIRNFNVRAKVVGPGGLFVKHIQSETGTRVQIKGHGSGFYEQETGREADEPMHISISGPDEAMVEKAKLLGEDLLLVVRSEFGKASAAHNAGHGASYGMPMGQGGFGGPGGFGPGGFGGPQQGHMQQQHQPGGYYGYAQAQQPPQPQGEAPPPPPGEDAPPPPPDDGAAPPPDAPAGAGAAPGAAAPAAGAPGGPTGPETPEQKAYREYWAAYGYDINDPAFQAWQAQTYYAQQAAGAGGAAAAPGAPTPAAPGGAPGQASPAQGGGAQGGPGIYGAVPPPAGL